MTTRLEKLEERLNREELRLDLKRLKQAREYMVLALETVKNQFHDPEFDAYISGIKSTLADIRQQLTNIIEAEPKQ